MSDLTDMFDPNLKNPSSSDLCSEIDEIMKHEDDDPLSSTPIDLDLDSLSDLLEPPRSASSSFSQQLNFNGLSLSFNNNSTTSSQNVNSFPQFYRSNTSQPPPYVSTDFGPYDVKRFRSASMNDGPSLYPPQSFVPFPFKTSTPVNPPPAYEQPSQSSSTTNLNWMFTDGPRPVSTSFSEVENHHQQQRQRLFRNTPSVFSQQTLYSINQSNKCLSLVDNIKDDPTSPMGTVEQQNDADLWSDIEQNSSDLIAEHDNTSDDETTTSIDYSKVSERSSSPPRFWKYNVQSKGPKTKRMLYLKERDPHLHREFSDPVYQIKLTQTNGGQALNKLRKGDGNDVTPNPTKLYQLGKQIRDLLKNTSSLYHGIYHAEHQTTQPNDSVEVKKEKNKLASKFVLLFISKRQ